MLAVYQEAFWALHTQALCPTKHSTEDPGLVQRSKDSTAELGFALSGVSLLCQMKPGLGRVAGFYGVGSSPSEGQKGDC